MQQDDSKSETEGEPADQRLNPQLFEERFVHDVYDKIAPHFSHTRHTVWPNVHKFIKSVEGQGAVLDCGAGNAKNTPRAAGSIAVEYSDSLVSMCRNRGCETIQADVLQLPFKDDTFVCSTLCFLLDVNVFCSTPCCASP